MGTGRAYFRMALLAMVATSLAACVSSPHAARYSKKSVPGATGEAAPSGDGLSATLVGLSADEIRTRFGSPDVTRAEASAELWQYARPGCVVLLYLYPNATAARQVTHVDELNATRADKTCVDQLAAPAARAAALTN